MKGLQTLSSSDFVLYRRILYAVEKPTERLLTELPEKYALTPLNKDKYYLISISEDGIMLASKLEILDTSNAILKTIIFPKLGILISLSFMLVVATYTIAKSLFGSSASSDWEIGALLVVLATITILILRSKINLLKEQLESILDGATGV